MVHHLVLAELLVELALDVGTGPKHGPCLALFTKLSKTVVLQREPHQVNVGAVVESEEIAAVGGFVGSKG